MNLNENINSFNDLPKMERKNTDDLRKDLLNNDYNNILYIININYNIRRNICCYVDSLMYIKDVLLKDKNNLDILTEFEYKIKNIINFIINQMETYDIIISYIIFKINKHLNLEYYLYDTDTSIHYINELYDLIYKHFYNLHIINYIYEMIYKLCIEYKLIK